MVLPRLWEQRIFRRVGIQREAVMSVVKRTSLGVDAKHKTKHSKVLRTRATGKEVDHSALIKRAIKRYPKTLARLAK